MTDALAIATAHTSGPSATLLATFIVAVVGAAGAIASAIIQASAARRSTSYAQLLRDIRQALTEALRDHDDHLRR